MFFAPSKSRQGANIWNMGEPQTRDHIVINFRMQNPGQEPQASSKDPKSGLKGHGCSLQLQNQDREPKFG